MVLNPVSPHLGFANALVLASTAVIELRVHTRHPAMLSVDGQVNVDLEDGDAVRVRLSPNVACFLRAQPAGYFYGALMNRLVQK
jgi:NAD+ kinase